MRRVRRGNRIREETKDASGAIAQVTSRVINSLNKVAAVQGAVGQTTQLAYDANGEPVSSTDPLNQTTRQSLDALRRPIATPLPDNTSAAQAWNQLDQLTTVRDPKGVATTYTRNAFGEVLSETSPDTGTTTYQRDAAGLVTARTDARGQTTRYEHDALGRTIRVTHADGQTEHHRYDAAGQTGALSEIEDASGITRTTRDPQGRITTQTQSVNDNPASPTTYRVQYGYSGGQRSQVTYPSGLKALYQRDATGQLTGIAVQPPGLLASASPFVTELTHTALGQPRAWRWAHCASGQPCDSAQRSFDTDGRITRTEFSSYQYDAAGRITGLSQQLWSRASNTTQGNAGNAATTPSPRQFSWSVGYDSRNRITRFNRTTPGSAQSQYSWDANSNRLTSMETTTAEADLQSLLGNPLQNQQASQSTQIESTSNRLQGFSQTLSTTQAGRTVATTRAQVNYRLDAAGNLTSDGLRQFEIDASGRIASVGIGRDNDEARVRYLHNALGQRVFKSEPRSADTSPSEEELGSDFVSWLRLNFGWLFSAGGTGNTQLGQAFVYDPSGALLGEYGNGASQGPGSMEVIWLPTQSGDHIPVGLYREGRLYAIHTDHLGTPRLITDDANQPVWQWPYSAWGTIAPTGVLKVTGSGNAAAGQNGKANTNAQAATGERLERTEPALAVNLRYPGQYFDAESQLFYNYFRSYQPGQGRYTQGDPIGLEGGLNRFGYVEGNPLSRIDPNGLQVIIIPGRRNGPRIVDPDLSPGVGPNKKSDPILQELIEREANRREYKNACNEPPPPGLNDCERAKWELKKWRSCKALREANTNKWWGGQDTRHDVQMMTDIEINISRAERAVRRICKEECP